MKRISRSVAETVLVWALACTARADVTASWNQDANGNWSAGGNWAGGSAAAGATGVATFSNTITDSRTVTVDSSPWTINGLIFGSTGDFGWTITGGTLDLAGTAPAITVNSGTAKVASALTGAAGLTKAGNGTLTLSGANSYSGGTTLAAGTLQIGDGASATASAGSGALAVTGNTLNLNLSGEATLINSSVTSYGLIQNIGTGKVTLTNDTIAGTLDGGSAGIVLANLISGQFTPKGDLTFGCASTAWTMWGNYPGLTLHIVNAGSFWWIGGVAPEKAMSLDIAAGVTVSLHPDQGYGTLYYNILSGPGNFTFDGGNASQLGYILGTSTLGGTLNANRPIFFGNGGATGAAGATTIASAANGPVTFDSTTDNTYSGNMSGAGALIKANANTLTLSGANTYSGATTVSGGTLAIGGAGTLGSGSYAGNILNNGELLYGSSAAQALSGGISGTGSLTKTNTSTLALSGYNTYSGATWVHAGTLVGKTGGACANSQVTVADGATNGVVMLVPGDQWTCAGLTYAGGVAGLEFDMAQFPVSAALAPLQVNGDLNVAGTVEVAVRNGFWTAVGSYPLVSYTGTLSGSGAFSLVSLPAGMAATLVNNVGAKRLDLSVTAVPSANGPVSVWTRLVGGNASGDWGDAANWSGGVPNVTDAVADFSTLDLGALANVNNDAPHTVGILRFADTSPSHDWAVGGSALTLATSVGMPAITVTSGGAYLSAGLEGTQGFIKDGPGLLVLNGLTNNTFSGQVVVSAGTLYVWRGASLKNTSGPITVSQGACFDLYSDWDGNALANPLYLSGSGIGPRGAAHIEANLVVNGPVTLLTDSKLTFENFCTMNGPITAVGAGKSLELGQPGLFEGRYSLNIYGSITLGTGALTFRSVPGGASETGYGVALNAANTYSGGTVLTDYAILRLGNAGALGSGGVTLAPTASLDLYTYGVTIPWLSGTGGTITDKHGAVGETTLTVNQATDTAYAGVINNGAIRSLALVKDGAGSLALSGSSTYTGPTTVLNGTLGVDGSLASASVTVGAGGAFAAGATGVVGRATLAGTLTFQDGSRLLVDSHSSSADTVSASGDVAIGSGVQLRVSDDQTSAGSWKVVESVSGTVSGNFVLVPGMNKAKLEKTANAVWLTIPPKGTLLLLK